MRLRVWRGFRLGEPDDFLQALATIFIPITGVAAALWAHCLFADGFAGKGKRCMMFRDASVRSETASNELGNRCSIRLSYGTAGAI